MSEQHYNHATSGSAGFSIAPDFLKHEQPVDELVKSILQLDTPRRHIFFVLEDAVSSTETPDRIGSGHQPKEQKQPRISFD